MHPLDLPTPDLTLPHPHPPQVKWMRALLDASGTTTAAVAPAAKYAAKLEAAARGALTEDDDEEAAAWAAVAEGRALVAKGDAAAAQAACEKALALAAYRPPAKTTSTAAGRPGLLTKQRSGVGLLARQASGLSKAGIVQPDAKSAARAGWLQKRGQVNTAFQRRYFLLNGSTLTYYDSEEGAKRGKTPKGQLSVVSVGHARKEDAPNLFGRRPRLPSNLRRQECRGQGETCQAQPTHSHISPHFPPAKAARRRRSLAGWKRWRLRYRRRPRPVAAAARRAVRPPRTGEIAMAAGDLAAAAARFAAALEIARPSAPKCWGWRAVCGSKERSASPSASTANSSTPTCCAPRRWWSRQMNIRGGLWSIALSGSSIALALGEEGADVWACSARCARRASSSRAPASSSPPLIPSTPASPSRSSPSAGAASKWGRDARGRRLREGARARPDARPPHIPPIPASSTGARAGPDHVDALGSAAPDTAGGRFDAAAADFEVAIKRDPTSAKAFSARGQLKAHPGFAGKMTDALDDFNTALKLDPRDGSALSGLFAHDDQWVDKAAHSGWLQKRGQVNTDFKKRYFLLHGAQLTYYDGEEAAGGASGKGTTRTSNMKGQLLIDSVAHARASDAPEVWMKDGLTLSEQLTPRARLRISPDGKDVILLCERVEDGQPTSCP